MGVNIIVCFVVISTYILHSSGNRLGSAPLGVALGDGDFDVEGVCSRPGPACNNCTHAVTCIALPVGWLRVPLQSCEEDGLSCNSRLGGCSKVPVPECSPEADTFDYVCEQVGIFPDAVNCQKFHLCSPPAEYPEYNQAADHRVAYCPRHYAYHALTAQCKIKLEYGQCESKPVPECQTVGQSGPLETSPNHYYVCLKKQGLLYPQIFVCPHGYYFYNNFCNEMQQQDSNSSVAPITTEKFVTSTVASTTEASAQPAILEKSLERQITPGTIGFRLPWINEDVNYAEIAEEQHNSFEYNSDSNEDF